ncbi:PKD domain-containing protein [Rhizosphaericola mali]|uniref:PKD domain-containing protein n=1 Tax=Rhizosphaericola mali TaxID=2545455 RepID=A0A5P2FUZ7_9BACT|nr:PKD domain-containing protein [Rhizosphaericola mali]QES87296.1 PKD domain-containing protein [Rhizosphaericola mali]
MNKKVINYFLIGITLIINILTIQDSKASHVKGGWIGYEFKGPGTRLNTSKYSVTTYLYIDCHNENGFRDFVVLGIFDGQTKQQVFIDSVYITDLKPLKKNSFSVCINNPPEVCYNVYSYTTTVELENNYGGYNINVQLRARVANIVNIINSENTGISLFAQIPKDSYYNNSSPKFKFLDTVAICHNSVVDIPFSATDDDGDSLSYDFGPGLDATTYNDGYAIQMPIAPPYRQLDYAQDYSGFKPMGNSIVVDPQTGHISGLAPDKIGEYVIAVYVKEWRNGVLIDSTKKELQIDVTNCQLATANLNPTYINCTDYSFTFKNNFTTNDNLIYQWSFGDAPDNTIQSTDANPKHDYLDTGVYILKLKLGKALECLDSTTAIVKVYPGFFPYFKTENFCVTNPTNFIDSSYLKIGKITSWLWNFGDGITSTQRNTTHQYSQAGLYNTQLTIESDKGCIDSISNSVNIIDKIQLRLPFTDTLICNKDSITLSAAQIDNVVYNWTNETLQLNNFANTESIRVLPKKNTTYQIIGADSNCKDTAYVHVNVLSDVTIDAPDIEMCEGDSVQIFTTSPALVYNWTKVAGSDSLNDYKIPNPSTKITGNNIYALTAAYGTCTNTKEIHVYASPYPIVNAGIDTSICQDQSYQLTGNTDATNYQWKNGPNQYNYTVKPSVTTSYIFLGSNPNNYCKKTVADTIRIKVIRKIQVNIGKDTSLVFGQPITFTPNVIDSTVPIHYYWTPNKYLNIDTIKNPTAIIPKGIESIVYSLTAISAGNCLATDQIVLKVFQSNPDIFVPSAFSPNHDGKNDILRPIPLGLKKLDIFEVFNRWGERIYFTNVIGEGWDGTLNNKVQPSGSTFIYHIRATDYNNKIIDKKGTTVIIQ